MPFLFFQKIMLLHDEEDPKIVQNGGPAELAIAYQSGQNVVFAPILLQ